MSDLYDVSCDEDRVCVTRDGRYYCEINAGCLRPGVSDDARIERSQQEAKARAIEIAAVLNGRVGAP